MPKGLNIEGVTLFAGVTIGVEEKGTVPSGTVPFPSFQSLPDLLDQIL